MLKLCCVYVYISIDMQILYVSSFWVVTLTALPEGFKSVFHNRTFEKLIEWAGTFQAVSFLGL